MPEGVPIPKHKRPRAKDEKDADQGDKAADQGDKPKASRGAAGSHRPGKTFPKPSKLPPGWEIKDSGSKEGRWYAHRRNPLGQQERLWDEDCWCEREQRCIVFKCAARHAHA